MARPGNMSARVMEAEMEEGEIVDELDYLSDISSEEEFLLRQRLQVLENYNNVLERKKAKRSLAPGTKHKKTQSSVPQQTKITAVDLAANCQFPKNIKIQISNVPKAYRHLKTHHKIRRKKDNHVDTHSRTKVIKKKPHKIRKRVSESSESSEETGSDYKDKRRKLANAVIVNKDKIDKTSLSARLKKMFGASIPDVAPTKSAIKEKKQTESQDNKKNDVGEDKNNLIDPIFSPISSTNADDSLLSAEIEDKVNSKDLIDGPSQGDLIDLCSDDENELGHNQHNNLNTNVCSHGNEEHSSENKNELCNEASENKKNNGKLRKKSEKDSDDDLELLRQNALQTKTVKAKTPTETENKVLSEDEDSDTAELRLICLKSALLKKAIEMKQKQRIRKKLSRSANLQDDFLKEHDFYSNKTSSDNNTDVESVDMEIVSDGDDKYKGSEKHGNRNNNFAEIINTESTEKSSKVNAQEDDFEEDEDLLRAKLLTSLSKNLPILVKSSLLDAIPNFNPEVTAPEPKDDIKNIPEEKRFIIKLGESDSEGEHEATKNLTKMHMKLSEKMEFQEKLDMFLKSTRMQVEKSTLPDVIQEPNVPKKTEKFVAKAVKHLPKPEQIEYKNLVRRMAELEKIKQSRQVIIHIHKSVPPLETLKPRNVSDSQKPASIDFLEQIAMSRKKIAEESAKMLKLKEEATKLSQKYKIVSTELHNITTAIALNKRHQKFVQNGLNKIRLQHQVLLRSNPIKKLSQGNGHMTSLNHINNKTNTTVKLQKENDPRKEEHKTQHTVRTVKLSSSESKDESLAPGPRLSIQVDVASNKKNISVPKSPDKDKHYDITRDNTETENVISKRLHSHNDVRNEASHPIVEKGGGHKTTPDAHAPKRRRKSIDDYESPLQALELSNWRADPNAILCPYEFSGECKDTDCKYLHTKTTTN